MNQVLIVGGIASLAFVVVFCSFLFRLIRFSTQGVVTRGTVMNYQNEILGVKHPAYQPMIQFKTEHGKTIQFTSGMGSNTKGYKADQEVPVVYLKKSPNTAEIKSFARLWLPVLVTAILAIGSNYIFFAELTK